MDRENDAPALEAFLENEKPAEEKPKKKRGFAAMDPEKVRDIAHRGGLAVHAKGTAHKFTREQAVEAGRKGGHAPHRVRGRKEGTP
jgi:general stress protein YciG